MAESDVVEKKVGFQWSRKLNLDLISARSSKRWTVHGRELQEKISVGENRGGHCQGKPWGG